MKNLLLILMFLTIKNIFAGSPLLTLSTNLSNHIFVHMEQDMRYTVYKDKIVKLIHNAGYYKTNDSTFYKDSLFCIYKSTNLAKTWEKIAILPDYFKKKDTGPAFSKVINDSIIFTQDVLGYVLYRSYDFGKTWDQPIDMVEITRKYISNAYDNPYVTIKPYITIGDFVWYNKNCGILACSDHRINKDYYLYTTDAGKTWNLSNLTNCERRTHYIIGLHYDKNGQIYIVSLSADNNTYLVTKSSDYGKTFSEYTMVNLAKVTDYTLMNDKMTKKYVLKDTPLVFFYIRNKE